MKQHNIIEIENTQEHEGFLGPGHTATTLIGSSQFQRRDPFILLMDDSLDLPGGPPVGGPHPHAGFETITLVLQGDDQSFPTGSLELMTAGKGIIHSEVITTKIQMRILQLWLVLPPEIRWIEPSVQRLLLDKVPGVNGSFGQVRVYAGSSLGMTSPIRLNTPLLLVEYQLNSGSSLTAQIPAFYRSFIYIISGTLWAAGTKLTSGQMGWLDLATTSQPGEILLVTNEHPVHFLLYGAQPQGAKIVANGPFVGDSAADIARLHHEYYKGEIPHLEDLDKSRITVY